MAGAEIRVLGDAEVAAELRATGSRLRQRLREAIVGEGEAMARYIATSKLSGQLVQVRTGRLLRGMTSKLISGAGNDGKPLIVDVYDQATKTVAGKRHRYGFMLAAGARGIPKVSEHMRRVPQRDVYRYMPVREGKKRTSIKLRRVAEWKVRVKAHRRNVNFKGRPIFDEAMRERASGINDRLRAVIDGVLAERRGVTDGGGI